MNKMQRLLLFSFFVLLMGPVAAQFRFEVGIKGGANYAGISFDKEDYSTESVLKMHAGGFMRVGVGRVFVQPEVYFSGKGGLLKSDAWSVATTFDFSTVDVPVLFGINVVNGDNFGFHIIGGPLYSNIARAEIRNSNIFNTQFYKDHYVGYQYGVGMDLLFLTIDARMENAIDAFYYQNGSSGKSSTFMISVGMKLF